MSVSNNRPDLTTLLRARSLEASLFGADNVVDGTFTFVGSTVRGWKDVDWEALGQNRLWRFYLHAFEWGLDLGDAYARTYDETYYERFRTLVRSWVTAHRQIRGDAWHPYPTSLRIVSWILTSVLFERALEEDPPFRKMLLGSIYQQTHYLRRNLEYDLLANHFLKNVKALFLAGRFFADGESAAWKKQSTRMLREQLEEQILADGGHFERSPTYHAIALRDVLDCILFVTPEEDSLKRQLESVATRMTAFLSSMLLGDGLYPLFNDAANNMAPVPAEILAYAEAVLGGEVSSGGNGQGTLPDDPPPLTHHADSGYVILQREGTKLIFDAGALGPDYQLGHAHCDLFSFEMTVDGERVIVDSGTPTYEEGPLRNACRSTRAHNTVIVDGEEQAEIWKSFRVARRPRPHGILVQQDDGFLVTSGWHDGFRRLPGRPTHKRTLFLIGEDILVVFDEITGTGAHHAASYLHLNPAATWNADDALVHLDELTFKVVPLDGLVFSVEQGFYAANMGSKEDSTVLRLECQGQLPLRLGYVLAPVNQQVERLSEQDAPRRLSVDGARGTYSLWYADGQWRCERAP